MKTTTNIPFLPWMGGWKTWAAAGLLVFIGVIEIALGEVEQGVGRIALAAGLVGLGHKIEKAGN